MLLLALAGALPAAAGTDLDGAREAAVQAARDGALPQARATLERLLEGHPDDRRLRFDLAVVAGWQGADARVAELLDGVDPETLPDYVLEAYAKAERNLKHWERARALYERLMQRRPDAAEPALARVLVLADAGRFDDARAALASLADGGAGEPAELAYAAGYVEERDRRFTRALAWYRRALRHAPEHVEARRRYAIAASALGATRQARALADAEPGLLDAATRTRLALDEAAMHVRWAPLPSPDAPRAHARAALEAQAALQQRPDLAEADTPRARALRFDHVAALAADRRMAEAVAAFEELDEPVDTLPLYVLSAAADAYAYLERPEEASRLYRAGVARAPERLDLQAGLFYARSDLQDYDGASGVAQALVDAEPAWRSPAPGVWSPSAAYAMGRELGALSLAFQDHYAAALGDFDDQLSVAPANTSARLARAQIRRWRGWYAAAASDVTRVRTLEPDSHRAQILAGHLALDERQFAAAESTVREAVRREPDARDTLALAERWRIHDSPELSLEAAAGRSDGGAFSSRDWRTDAWWFSAPVRHRYRAFAHDTVSWGRFDEGDGRDHRLGAGVEYRLPRWTMRGELYRGLADDRRSGAALDVDWRLDDHLSFSLGGDLNSREVPLRGVRAGVHGDAVEAGARYRWHESRELAVSAGRLDLSDGNDREWGSAAFTTRVFNRPRHKVHLSARGYASRNSATGVAYYNPASDRELALGATHEWRVFRRYDHGLVQRVGIEAGDYWQEDFGSGAVWSLFAEHDWQLGPRTALRYGVRTGGRVYDGEREHAAALFLGVTWRP